MTHSRASRSSRWPAVAVRRRDSTPTWTWIAVGGLVMALALAIVGIPHANIHGLLHYLGVMDPLCGGTRSVYLTLHGRLREALRYNPGGPLIVLAMVAMAVRAAVGWSTGRWLTVRVPPRILIPVAVVAVSALEVNQQLHAALLTQPWTG